jgi:hypothetical protein
VTRRRPAFDPTALDESLDAIPPVPSAERPVVPRAPRPSGAAISVVAVRVPRSLYAEVVRRLSDAERAHPSYAQLVAWTCEDRRDEVVARLERALRPSARRPRGRRPASDSVPLTLRFQLAELAALDAVIARAHAASVAVTRTAAVAAALDEWTVASAPASVPSTAARTEGSPAFGVVP